MYKCAVVGDRDSVTGFQVLGLDTVCVTDKDETEKALKRLASENYTIIFITEQMAMLASDILEIYKSKPFPAIIPIPNNQGSTGFGINGLRSNVEKAIGADILFNDKGEKSNG